VCRDRSIPLTSSDESWSARLARIAVTGAAAALAAMVSFMAFHSLLIAPIWTRAANGMPLALVGGIALAASFDRIAALRGWRSMLDGARFGALMFTTLTPATVFSNALRLAGAEANGWPGAVASLTIAAATGASAGWLLTRRRDGTVACAGAAAALIVAMAGPVPVVNGPRAAWLFVGFLPICTGAGIVVAMVRRRIVREENS
jgi:hypothetical protein